MLSKAKVFSAGLACMNTVDAFQFMDFVPKEVKHLVDEHQDVIDHFKEDSMKVYEHL